MLQGEAFELDLMQRGARDIYQLLRKRHDVMFFMDMAEWMFFHSPQARFEESGSL